MRRAFKVARARSTVDCSCQALSARAFCVTSAGSAAKRLPWCRSRKRDRPLSILARIPIALSASIQSHCHRPAGPVNHVAFLTRRSTAETVGHIVTGQCHAPSFRLRLWLSSLLRSAVTGRRDTLLSCSNNFLPVRHRTCHKSQPLDHARDVGSALRSVGPSRKGVAPAFAGHAGNRAPHWFSGHFILRLYGASLSHARKTFFPFRWI